MSRRAATREPAARGGLWLGLAHHLGWAVAVTATADHEVLDRRRIALVEEDLPAAPVHHHGGPHLLHRQGEPLSDAALGRLAARVRASAERTASAELDDLIETLPGPIVSMSLRAWPADFPTDIGRQRGAPFEATADSVMYRQVLAQLASNRSWVLHLFDAKTVEDEATRRLGERAARVLYGPRETWGPPWSRDHRIALAATIVAT